MKRVARLLLLLAVARGGEAVSERSPGGLLGRLGEEGRRLLARLDARELPLLGRALVLLRDPLAPPDLHPPSSFLSGLAQFLRTRSLQIDLPHFFRDDLVEGRKHKKGYGLLFVLGGILMAKGFFILATLAGKALAASKAALLIAALGALRKGGHGSGYSSYEVLSIPAAHHRSFPRQSDTHAPLPHPYTYPYPSYDPSE